MESCKTSFCNIDLFSLGTLVMWHEIFVGSNFRGFFVDPLKLNPVKINSSQKIFRENLLPFVDTNFS